MAIPIESNEQVQPGATLDAASGGTINATEINGVPIPSTNSGVAGKIPITQGDGSAAWADPYVQGVFPAGTVVATANGASPPVPLYPVMVGGSDGTDLRILKVDSSGSIYIGNSSLNVVLGAETTKVIGTVNIASGQSIGITANSSINLSQVNGHTTVESHQNGVLSVGGDGAAGTALTSTEYPLLIAGSDYGGTPAKQVLKIDSSGIASVQFNAAQHVIADSLPSVTIGTWSAGTLTVQGGLTNNNAVPGATNIGVLPALCNTSAPTFTDGKQTLLSVDTSGNLRVTGAGGGTQFADNAASGSTPTGTLAMGWDSANSKIRALKVDANQYLQVAIAASSLNDPAEQTTGSAVPSKTIQIGGSDGTNLQALQVDPAFNLKTFPGINTKNSAATWTTATALNTTTSLTPAGSGGGPAILVQSDANGGTFTAGAITFEGSYDGTNFITVPAAQVIDPASSAQVSVPYTIVASTNKAFLILVGGFQAVRVKLSTAITGSSSPQIVLYYSQLSYLPFPQLTAAGADKIDITTIAGTAPSTAGKLDIKGASGDVTVYVKGNAGAAVDAALGTAPTNAFGAALCPITSGGLSTTVAQGLKATATSVKGSAGQMYGYSIFNPNTSTSWVFWYNNSTPTVGSTTNLIFEIGIPAGAAANVEFTNGIAFSTVIYVAAATTETGNTAPTTGLTVTTLYK